MSMKEKIEKLIQKYESKNENILKRRPDLEVQSDFSPEGIQIYLISRLYKICIIKYIKTLIACYK